MKSLITTALVSLVALSASAQNEKSFQTRALLIEESGAHQVVWITAASKTGVRYKATEIAQATKDAKISAYQSIFLFEPPEFTLAKDLYQSRKYEEAKAKFAELKVKYKPVRTLRNNPGALAGYYELECLRKLKDLEGLSAALKDFDKSALTRAFQLRQLELYVIWDAVRTQSWDRVEILVNERKTSNLPGFQRAQLAYLQGLALEGMEKPDEALDAYATAMSADAAASEVIVRNSALRTLAILSAKDEVQRAIKEAGTKDENKNSRAYGYLLEGASVATLFELGLGAGEPLPEEYKVFLKFQPKPEEPKSEAKEEKKEEPKKKPAPKKPAPKKKKK